MVRKNRYHTLWRSTYNIIPKDLIFVDTETDERKHKEKIKFDKNKLRQREERYVKKLKFRLGCFIHWNTEDNTKKEVSFKNKNVFWDYLDKLDLNEVTVLAHNTEFDFKILDGYNQLIRKRNYELDNIYIEGKVFIMSVVKENKKIIFLDTFNYCPTSLDKMGESIGLKKTKVDFDYVTDEALNAYCMNDTRIIQLFMEKFLKFLSDNELGGLRSTISGCAFNSFCKRFYDPKKIPIMIHNHPLAVPLERESYKGGLCDCLKVGEYKEHLYKLDINSMYPYIMKKYRSPIKHIFYSRDIFEFDLKDKLLKELRSNRYQVIAKIECYLPYNKAHLLTRFKYDKQEKNGFLYGTFTTVLTTPELHYLLKHGKILKVYELSVYRCDFINTEYVDFFYNERLKAIDKGDDAYNLLAKLFLNAYYGKWGQKGSSYTRLDELMPDFDFMRLNVNTVDEKYTGIQFGNVVYKIAPTNVSSFDSFVAIASFITSYARMYLITLMEKAGKNNSYYMDTDCLIVNKTGFDRLKNYIDFSDNKVLGKLELEGESDYSCFYRPKYYEFGEELKCKGVRKDHTVLEENDDFLWVEQEQFQKFKTAFKEGSYDHQKIIEIDKLMSKKYNKGRVIDNIVYPFHVSDVVIKPFVITDM